MFEITDRDRLLYALCLCSVYIAKFQAFFTFSKCLSHIGLITFAVLGAIAKLVHLFLLLKFPEEKHTVDLKDNNSTLYVN